MSSIISIIFAKKLIYFKTFCFKAAKNLIHFFLSQKTSLKNSEREREREHECLCARGVCVSVCERERERERECVCVCACRQHANECVDVRELEKENGKSALKQNMNYYHCL